MIVQEMTTNFGDGGDMTAMVGDSGIGAGAKTGMNTHCFPSALSTLRLRSALSRDLLFLSRAFSRAFKSGG